MLELAQNLLALTEKEKMFFDTIYSGEGLGQSPLFENTEVAVTLPSIWRSYGDFSSSRGKYHNVQHFRVLLFMNVHDLLGRSVN